MSDANLYAEFVTGDVKHRGTVVPRASVRPTPGQLECYRSLYLHGPALVEWVQKTGSVRGYEGPHTSEAFVVDVDCKDDLERARTDAVRILEYLYAEYELPIEVVRIAFSGAKGFHLVVPMAAIAAEHMRPHFAAIQHEMASRMFKGFDTVDLAIYESKRIFRLPNTVNGKTGLHKVYLSYQELRSDIDTIRQIAASPRKASVEDLGYLPVGEVSRCPALAELFADCERTAKDGARTRHYAAPEKTDEAEEVLTDAATLQGIFGGDGEGGRNNRLVRFCGLMISRGIDRSFCTELARVWNLQNRPPLDDAELVETVDKQYRQYSKGAAQEGFEVFDMKRAAEEYRRYVERMKEARVTTGFPPLDEYMRAIAPGEVVCILGKTSVGKSALLQNIGHNYGQRSGAPILFFSLEMPVTSVFEREAQLHLDIRGKDVEAAFHKTTEEVERFCERVYSASSNLFVVVKPQTIESIGAYIRYAETEIYRQKTGLVLIDYLGLLKGKGKDIYEQISRVARDMKDLAKEHDVPVMYLSQVNRAYKIDQELEIGAARDSGAIDEAADYILGVWRTPEQPVEQSMRCEVGILKNRKGGLVKFQAFMDKISLRFTLVDPRQTWAEDTPPQQEANF
jgi:replicative DNA helicase